MQKKNYFRTTTKKMGNRIQRIAFALHDINAGKQNKKFRREPAKGRSVKFTKTRYAFVFFLPLAFHFFFFL